VKDFAAPPIRRLDHAQKQREPIMAANYSRTTFVHSLNIIIDKVYSSRAATDNHRAIVELATQEVVVVKLLEVPSIRILSKHG
jgi:hypothetical protein